MKFVNDMKINVNGSLVSSKSLNFEDGKWKYIMGHSDSMPRLDDTSIP